MKKVILIILCFLYTNLHALLPYEANYALNASTDLGSLKVGSAEFKLELNGSNEFIFSSQSYTDSIWKKLYNYTRYEKSIGSIEEDHIKGGLYDVVEIEKEGVTKNNKILINYDEGFVIVNNDKKWNSNSKIILDELNVYLALSESLKKNPNQTEYSFQVADEKGIQLVTFMKSGDETINIEDLSINSIKLSSPELKISINVSEKYNYIPLIIDRNSSKTRFRLILTSYKPS
jgi:hypothetical protein